MLSKRLGWRGLGIAYHSVEFFWGGKGGERVAGGSGEEASGL